MTVGYSGSTLDRHKFKGLLELRAPQVCEIGVEFGFLDTQNAVGQYYAPQSSSKPLKTHFVHSTDVSEMRGKGPTGWMHFSDESRHRIDLSKPNFPRVDKILHLIFKPLTDDFEFFLVKIIVGGGGKDKNRERGPQLFPHCPGASNRRCLGGGWAKGLLTLWFGGRQLGKVEQQYFSKELVCGCDFAVIVSDEALDAVAAEHSKALSLVTDCFDNWSFRPFHETLHGDPATGPFAAGILVVDDGIELFQVRYESELPFLFLYISFPFLSGSFGFIGIKNFRPGQWERLFVEQFVHLVVIIIFEIDDGRGKTTLYLKSFQNRRCLTVHGRGSAKKPIQQFHPTTPFENCGIMMRFRVTGKGERNAA